MKKKFNIEQIENILDWAEDQPIEILPNGEVKFKNKGNSTDRKETEKPITLREDIGGEYTQKGVFYVIPTSPSV